MVDFANTQPIHFLHIHKTGGTAMAVALAAESRIVLHRHRTRLRDVPPGEPVFFCVRDPIKRFVSGFNSRLRRGMPHHLAAWSKSEAQAFEMFPNPNSLAEALYRDPRADIAMGGIGLVRTHYNYWLSKDELKTRSGDIIYICRQETLGTDFENLKRLLGLKADSVLPADDILAHRTPDGFDTHLSSIGRANLARWFASDTRLLEMLLSHRDKILSALGIARGG